MMLALGLGLLIAPGAARAQNNNDALPELSKDWAIRIGVYIYQSQSTRSANGEVGLSAIFERTVFRNDMLDVNVGIGYNVFDRVYNIPIQVSGIIRKNNLRVGGGLGYAFGKRIDGTGTSGAAMSLILGYQLSQSRSPLSLDLRYYFISGSDNELDGYSL